MDAFLHLLIVILFGFVEGITEWLPVSSTGHLIVLEEWLSISKFTSPEFYELFEVVIQLGAITAVIVTFFKKLWPFGANKTKEEKKATWKLWLNILIACVPAAIVGLLLDDFLDQYLYNFLTVSITLLVYGVAFVVIEYEMKIRETPLKKTDLQFLNWKDALIIGLAQVLALIPGTSRSGVTIIAALLLSYNRSTAAEFSFLLSIPVMVGASLFKAVKFVVKGYSMPDNGILYLAVGCLVAAVTSFFVIKFFLKLIRGRSFVGFGLYRIALGSVLLILYFALIMNAGTLPPATSDVSELVSSTSIALKNAKIGRLLMINR